MKALFLFSISIFLIACAGPNKEVLHTFGVEASTADANHGAGVKRPFVGTDDYYFQTANFPYDAIPTMPMEGSSKDKKDLAAVLQYQKKRTEKDCARAEKEVGPSFMNFFGELHPFKNPQDPKLEEIFWKIRSDVARTTSLFKKEYKRLRPFLRDDRIEPCIKKESGFAYPSGHSSIAIVYGKILEALDPKNKKLYRKRAHEVGEGRIYGGVHHPLDVQAGRKLGEILLEKLLASESFQKDLDILRADLKTPPVSQKP